MQVALIVLFALGLVCGFYTVAMPRPFRALPILSVVSLVAFIIIGTIFHPLVGIIGIVAITIFLLEALLPIEKIPKWMDVIFWPSVFLGSATVVFIVVEAFAGRFF